MSGPPGFGRGGRGAALRNILENPIRRPGQVAEATNGHAQAERVSPPLQGPAAGAASHPSAGAASYPAAANGSRATGGQGDVGRSGPSKPQPNMGRGLTGLYQQLSLSRGSSPTASGTSTPLSGSGTSSGTATPPSRTNTPPLSSGTQHASQPTGRGVASLPSRSPAPFGRGIASLKQRASPLTQSSPNPSPVEQTPGSVTPQTPPSPASPSELRPELAMKGISKGLIPQPIPDQQRMAAASNYIPIKFETSQVWQYAVSFHPHVESKGMKMKLVFTHLDNISKVRAFDGSTLFMPIQLPEKVTTFKSVGLKDDVEYHVKIQMVKSLQPKECIQLYNIIFRRVMRILDMKQVGRHYYSPSLATAVPQHKLEIWPGYVTAINEHSNGLMLHLDVSHKVLCYETVLDTMAEIYRQNQSNFQDECRRQIVGTVVLTRYNNQTYRVDDITWEKNPMSTFLYHNNEEMTFADYYRKMHQKEITDLKQPLLISQPKKKELPKGVKPSVICLIPELVSRTGLTDEMRTDFRVMKDLASHTRITPNQRHLSLRQFVEKMYKTPDALKELTNWGMHLDRDILRLDAKQLPRETIKMQQNSYTVSPEADWGREIGRDKVILPVDLKHWLLVFCKRDARRANDFLNMFQRVCPQMGIQVQPPVRFELQDDRTQTYLNNIRDAINPQLQLVVIIFPTSRDDRYNAIKKLCCVEKAIPSQVIISRTISQQQKLRSVTQKIGLQINCKLGGELWSVDIPVTKMMVVGIDVYHDPSKGGKSIGGFVASTNKLLTRWYSRVCFQTPQQELIDGLKICLIASIKKYHEVNHDLPQKIVIFRDGVGDGQLATVATYEQEQLTSCFATFGDTYNPSLTIVIVQKRINTRIFSLKNGHQLENPSPGCVVDHTITRPQWYDFFLVSQHVRQGTVTPTHYVIVYDTSKFKPDQMQRLSYKLTHLYYNWPGTVRVPAPCQYAHKLAYQVGENLKREPSLQLADRLFFL